MERFRADEDGGTHMAKCIVPACSAEAANNLGIRLRRPDTTAIWAPNTDAYVCDVHARKGALVHVYYETSDDDQVEVHVHGSTHEVSRVTKINRAPDVVEDLAKRVRK
jgi:hypothetical protein